MFNLKYYSYDGWHGYGRWYWDVDFLFLDFYYFDPVDYVAHQTDQKVENVKKPHLLLLVFIIGFLTNMVWENAQAFLYEGYTGFLSHFMICFIATIVDALVILLFYLCIAVIRRDMYWIQYWDWKLINLLMIAGGVVVVGFEKWALLKGEWSYTEAMPVVPFLEVGLLPLLQLMILPVLTFYICGEILKYFGGAQ